MTSEATIDDADVRRLAATGLRLIRSLQTPSGAYPASPTFSAYAGYSWFRDGSFIADASSVAGATESASAFHDWCASVIVSRATRIDEIVARAASGQPAPDEAMLATRFTFEGEEGTADWWDFQMDGYGTWMWAVAAHCARHRLDPARWRTALELCARYVASSWARPCFDWWEEHSDQLHVSTVGCLAAGLRAAIGTNLLTEGTAAHALQALTDMAALLDDAACTDSHLTKWIGNPAVDGSLAALVGILGVVDARSTVGRGTIAAIERDLVREDGTFRYLGDTFYGGGQWPLLTCMLGQAHLAAGDRVRACELLRWAASTADAAGMMPEQVPHHLNDPGRVAEWVHRWGPAARPLLWSHAMFLRLALDLGTVSPSDLKEERA